MLANGSKAEWRLSTKNADGPLSNAFTLRLCSQQRSSHGLKSGLDPGLHQSSQRTVSAQQNVCLEAADVLARSYRPRSMRGDLRPLAPALWAAQPSLGAFVRYVGEAKDRALRRDLVRNHSKPLWGEIGGPEAINSVARRSHRVHRTRPAPTLGQAFIPPCSREARP